jgi:hypothetical protein
MTKKAKLKKDYIYNEEAITGRNRNWKPKKIGEKYWFEDTNGFIQQVYYGRHSADRHRIQHVRIFPSKEEAVQWQKAKNRLFDLRDEINGDWMPDWDRSDKVKYYLIYDWEYEKALVYQAFVVEQSHDIWFKEDPKKYCDENGINWDDIQEAFKIYLRVI